MTREGVATLAAWRRRKAASDVTRLRALLSCALEAVSRPDPDWAAFGRALREVSWRAAVEERLLCGDWQDSGVKPWAR